MLEVPQCAVVSSRPRNSRSRIFIYIVQISSLVTTSIGQSLLTFWSHPEQSWMFALKVVALKITYVILKLYIANAYVNFEGRCKLHVD